MEGKERQWSAMDGNGWKMMALKGKGRQRKASNERGDEGRLVMAKKE